MDNLVEKGFKNMKPRQFKKIVSSFLSFLLIFVMIFSISSSKVFANNGIFTTGIDVLEVEEGQMINLLQGVTSISPSEENLQVFVKNVICENDGNYQYDHSGFLVAGSAGAVYRIEYEAKSSINVTETYVFYRYIKVIPKVIPNENFEETPEGNLEGFFDESIEEIPNGNMQEVPEENGEVVFDESIEEIPDGNMQEIPEENGEVAPDGSIEEVPNGNVEEIPGENTEEIPNNGTEDFPYGEPEDNLNNETQENPDGSEEFSDIIVEEFPNDSEQEILGESESESESEEDVLDIVIEEFSDGNEEMTVAEGTQILFENGIHYIIDPQYPDKKITLFCMNNKLHWPHHTEGMGDTQVPGYTEGYLTPEDFQSLDAYNECMRRLSKLLYAGYPYNGERLYQIVADSSGYTPSEAEFNEMLIVPPVLQTAYPFLGHHDFTYADWTTSNKEHLEYLRQFVEEVIKLNIHGGTTPNGLTYADISSMPFYRAAFSITNCNSGTPLTTFQFFYGASYFVTEEEAYNATQDAVWHLLYTYGIPDNNLASMSLPLSQILYTYSERGGLLNYRPSLSDIKLSGDLTFTYNPKDAMWHSSPLRLIEPDEYRGLYHLSLPEGMTALCDNLSYVYGNEEYELVSDHQPTQGESFGIQADFVWLEEFKQYSPSPDIEFKGKKFQHMIGAVIHNESLSAWVPIAAANVGDVSITKTVVGEENCQEEFQFEFRLPYHQGISGLYGDLEFHKGVANFSLKAGETKMAHNLPADAQYIVTELETQGYQIGSINSEGQVPISDVQAVTFTNTKLPDLSLSKIVTGEMGDKTKCFNFIIQLKDETGTPVDGSYPYIGGVKEGFGTEIQKPADGQLVFTNGEANITLSNGQQITIKDLPYKATYTITEVEANEDHYITTYNNETAQNVTGVLTSDTSIEVVNNKEFVPPTGIAFQSGNGIGIGTVISLSAIIFLLIVGLFQWRKGLKK